MFEAEAEAEAKALRPRPRPRPKFWPRGHFGLEALTSQVFFLLKNAFFIEKILASFQLASFKLLDFESKVHPTFVHSVTVRP